MNLNRKIVRVYKAGSEPADSPAVMTKSEAFAFVWELTQEAYSLSGRHDVQSRLQRHVVAITRKQG
jgi:hypothetical protein